MPINPVDPDVRFAQIWHIATLGLPSTLMEGTNSWILLTNMGLVKRRGYNWMRQRVYSAVRAGYIVEHNPTPGKKRRFVAVQDKLV